MSYTYIEAIGKGFPDVHCHVVGDSNLYEDIVWDSGLPIPDKTTLDQWILSNDNNSTDRKITVFAFRNRYTKAEKVKIDMASIDNPALAIDHPSRLLAAALRVDLKDSDSASFIDLNRPETRAGVIALETYGIIAAGRALEILDAPVQSIERQMNRDYT